MARLRINNDFYAFNSEPTKINSVIEIITETVVRKGLDLYTSAGVLIEKSRFAYAEQIREQLKKGKLVYFLAY